jgi:hypothetical protein
MKNMRARVRGVTGATRHLVAGIEDGEFVNVEPQPVADWVEIEECAGGVLLLRWTDAGEFGGDTWHESTERAKDQARFEYEIEEEDWHVPE